MVRQSAKPWWLAIFDNVSPARTVYQVPPIVPPVCASVLGPGIGRLLRERHLARACAASLPAGATVRIERALQLPPVGGGHLVFGGGGKARSMRRVAPACR